MVVSIIIGKERGKLRIKKVRRSNKRRKENMELGGNMDKMEGNLKKKFIEF